MRFREDEEGDLSLMELTRRSAQPGPGLEIKESNDPGEAHQAREQSGTQAEVLGPPLAISLPPGLEDFASQEKRDHDARPTGETPPTKTMRSGDDADIPMVQSRASGSSDAVPRGRPHEHTHAARARSRTPIRTTADTVEETAPQKAA